MLHSVRDLHSSHSKDSPPHIHAYKAASLNMQKTAAAEEILNACNDGNFILVPLKGIALIETLYKEIPVRPMTDMDFLAKKEELKGIAAVLGRLGYSCFSSYRGSYTFSHKKNNIFLDIHTAFVRFPELFRISDDEISGRLHNHLFNERVQVPLLCPEHQLVHIALHLSPGIYSDSG